MRLLRLLALSLMPAVAFAQAKTTVAPPNAAECTSAIGTLQSGSLAAPDSQTAAGTIIEGCGTPGFNTLAAAMRRRRTSTDVVEMYRYFNPSVADTAILAAALDIATDMSASTPARVLSMGILLPYMGNQSPLTYSGLVSASEGDVCGGGAITDTVYWQNNLPATAPATIVSRVAPFEHDARQPIAVRSAANCIMNAWRVMQSLPVQPLFSYTAVPLSIDYICGTRFRVKNTLSFPIWVQWAPTGSSSKSNLYALGSVAGKTYGASEFDSHAHRTPVELYFDGQLVGSATPAGAGCP